MEKPQLVAADTNVILRLASGDDATVDAWQLLRRRVQGVQFLALPTVLGEIGAKVTGDADPLVHAAALKALRELRPRWEFQPVIFNAVQQAIADNARDRLREAGLVPWQERNDAAILSESATMECILLVSGDSHLLSIDHERLAFLFRQLDLATPLIASPERLLRDFFR